MSDKFLNIYEFEHEGGTKNYHVIVLGDLSSKTGIIMKRNGPVGKKGQVQMISKVLNLYTVQYEANKEGEQRRKRGYRFKATLDTFRVSSTPNLIDQNIQAGLDKAFLAHIDITNAIMNWMRDGEGSVDSAESKECLPDEAAQDLDRGELWGSW